VVLERQLEYHFHALDFENEAFSKPHAHGTHSHTVITLEASSHRGSSRASQLVLIYTIVPTYIREEVPQHGFSGKGWTRDETKPTANMMGDGFWISIERGE
jgi:hypothetical protein